MTPVQLSSFDYHLPPELIAQRPAKKRSESRLLFVPEAGDFEDCIFSKLPKLLRAGDLLVFNNSKVMPARLHARKKTGGLVEILIERVVSDTIAVVMLKANRKPLRGECLDLLSPGSAPYPDDSKGPPSRRVMLLGRHPSYDDRFIVDFEESVLQVLEEWGEIPLPPYISRDPHREDSLRYQTIFASRPGSIAAPTAGLHFDAGVLDELAKAGVDTCAVTLHVGSGTFSPVRSEKLEDHKMHTEWCSIDADVEEKILSARACKRRIIAVGTTSLRLLESWASSFGDSLSSDRPRSSNGGKQWETDLFIRPGFNFRVVDGLLTNFHLPKSTLLILVSAFAGVTRIREVYSHGINKKYRFFSYGDCMLLFPNRR